MGLWGKFSSLFSGPPSADTPKPYTEDPYMGEGGPGRERAFGADEMAFNELQKMSDRPYGFTDDEMRQMYSPAAGQIDLSTQANMRRVNRDAAASGAYGSGGRRRGISAATEKGGRSKANLQWQTKAFQARTALQDRYKRLAAMNAYSLPRLGLSAGEHGRRLGYDMGINTLNRDAYKTALGQYNQDFDWAWNEGTGGSGSALDAWG